MSRSRVAPLLSLLALAACSGGGSGEPGPAIVSVAITLPASAPTLVAVGRTAQFAAEARAAGDVLVPGASVSWSTSSPSVATVSGTGLVTALANGTTNIRATSGGVQSLPVLVTVNQIPASVRITPNPVEVVGIGGTRQLAAAELDSNDAVIPGAPAITWTRLGPGTHASVSASGLVTGLALGTSDTAQATIGARSALAPIAVVATASIPSAATVSIGDNFFRSVRNNTQNRAIDTVAVGGVVTWNYIGTGNHNVNSTGSPSFTGNAVTNSGSYQFTFTNTGSYEYQCQIHGSMTGRIVVR